MASTFVGRAAASDDFTSLAVDQQNQWLLARILTPAEATQILGVPGRVLNEGGDDRYCTDVKTQVQCMDSWGWRTTWQPNDVANPWPAVAVPEGVQVKWFGEGPSAKQALDWSRSTYGVVDSQPLEVAIFKDQSPYLAGLSPRATSYRVSGGWLVSASCVSPEVYSQVDSRYVYQQVPQAKLLECAKRVVRDQFTRLGVTPTEVTPPEAPSGVLLTVKGPAANVTWIAPVNDGGLPITGYEAISRDGALKCTTAPTAAVVQSCLATGAKPGVSYSFTVVARNEAGDSPPSQASRPGRFVERSSAPRAASARTSGTMAFIRWRRPLTLGGLPILRYVVTASSGSSTCATTTLSCSLVGLDYSTRYQFQVRAINARGASTPAVTSWIRTAPAPSPPPVPVPTPEPTPEKSVAPIS
jgi:hypothetical protein